MDESEWVLRRLSRAVGPMPADLTAKVKELIRLEFAAESVPGGAHFLKGATDRSAEGEC
ncbi:hypothetical protein [Kitasatospora sp. NPDC090091]|uniref:hypothetical protein n=1 Tax=Kitasatospora sp. NPDC090091 TaxID=3364081 RepID=UPI0037FA77B9